jgi:fluoroquinolone transport system permease protein
MNLRMIFTALGPIDLRNIRRDSLLPWMVAMPLAFAVLLRWGVPALTENLLAQNNFDLRPYYPVISAYFIVGMPALVLATLIGFLLLDEKDDATMTALQVTPLSLNTYVAYRVAVPALLTIVLMFLMFPVVNLEVLSWGAILLIGIASAATAPMFALYLAALAQNKVQGFALVKLSGFVTLLPVLAFFVEPGWDLLFGVIPTYWPMKVYWTLSAGEAGAGLYALVGVVYQSLVAGVFIRRFYQMLHR